MNVALLGAALVLLAATSVLSLRLLDAGRARRAIEAERDRIIARFRDETNRLHVNLDDMHKDALAILQQRETQHAAALDDLRAGHAREIDRMNSIHMIALERLSNMMQFGAPTKTEAVVSNPEPDAETRIITAISEDTIAKGVADLKREYDARGIPVTEAELREEVQSMMMGVGLSRDTLAARTLPVKD